MGQNSPPNHWRESWWDSTFRPSGAHRVVTSPQSSPNSIGISGAITTLLRSSSLVATGPTRFCPVPFFSVCVWQQLNFLFSILSRRPRGSRWRIITGSGCTCATMTLMSVSCWLRTRWKQSQRWWWWILMAASWPQAPGTTCTRVPPCFSSGNQPFPWHHPNSCSTGRWRLPALRCKYISLVTGAWTHTFSLSKNRPSSSPCQSLFFFYSLSSTKWHVEIGWDRNVGVLFCSRVEGYFASKNCGSKPPSGSSTLTTPTKKGISEHPEKNWVRNHCMWAWNLLNGGADQRK